MPDAITKLPPTLRHNDMMATPASGVLQDDIPTSMGNQAVSHDMVYAPDPTYGGTVRQRMDRYRGYLPKPYFPWQVTGFVCIKICCASGLFCCSLPNPYW